MKQRGFSTEPEEDEDIDVPFKSPQQRKFLFDKAPAVAQAWADEEKKNKRTPLSVEERRKQLRQEALKRRAAQK